LVRWNGQDDAGGSGIARYSVFVSTDGGPFEQWLRDVAVTEAPFAGTLGRRYAFYSISRDNVGHTEAPPAVADTTTTITANLPPVLSAISDVITDEGHPFAMSAIATDPNAGDVLQYSLDPGAPAGMAIDPSTGRISWTPANGPSSAMVTVRVADAGSPRLTDARSFLVTVRNVSPTVNAGSDFTIRAGEAWSRIGSYTDPGADSWAASVDYGTGQGFSPLALQSSQTFAVSHVYGTPGSYTVTVRITDQDGGVGTSQFVVSVAPPPDATPPRVSSFRTTKKNGNLDTIRIGFSETMAPAGVLALGSYSLISAGRDKKFGTRDDKILALGSVQYDPVKRFATIRPRKRIALNQPLQLVVRGDGAIRDLAFNALDGNADGQAGGHFARRFGSKPRR
jgi:hypothetical protein